MDKKKIRNVVSFTCTSGSRCGQEGNKECSEFQHALVVADMDKKENKECSVKDMY